MYGKSRLELGQGIMGGGEGGRKKPLQNRAEELGSIFLA